MFLKGIISILTNLKTAHAAKDLPGIDAGLEALNQAWQAASEELYKAMNDQQAGGASAEGQPTANSNDEIVDAEIVEEEAK